jgi:hypothetical protein
MSLGRGVRSAECGIALVPCPRGKRRNPQNHSIAEFGIGDDRRARQTGAVVSGIGIRGTRARQNGAKLSYSLENQGKSRQIKPPHGQFFSKTGNAARGLMARRYWLGCRKTRRLGSYDNYVNYVNLHLRELPIGRAGVYESLDSFTSSHHLTKCQKVRGSLIVAYSHLSALICAYLRVIGKDYPKRRQELEDRG